MDWIWIGLGILLVLLGLVGSLLPLIPGPPLAFLGLVVQQFRTPAPFSVQFLLIAGGLVLLLIILDYLVPIWGTRRFGGTRFGMWGCSLGFLAAFWMGPWGVIVGPFVGAFLGELLARQGTQNALRAAAGSFLGFLLGSLLKIIACLLMFYFLIGSIS